MSVGLIAALRGLAANKLRSFLTMLGVIFGVAAVIVAVALGQGSRDASMRRFQRFGTRTLTIMPGRQSRSGISFGSVSTLKIDDAKAIQRGAPSVKNVSPERSGFLQVKAGNKNTNPQVYGTGAAFPKIRNFDFAQGTYFTEQDVRSKRFVCVLGYQVYKDLFGSGNVVGQKVYIKGQNFKITGVFKERGGGGFVNEDDRVYVPITSALRRLFGSDNVLSGMSVEGRSEGAMQKAQDEVTEVLKRKHKISANKPNDFIIFNNAVAAQNSSEQAADFEQLISWLAAVALIVGGIGIMNIMLVSVTERTREIGVRKAIGAKRWHILLQFLLEALFLSLTGGLIGVIAGVVFTKFGLPNLKPQWETTLSWPPIFIAFGFSAIVGVFFGYYPAYKASKLDPISALRFE
jgi:putative ABC transport system permease protein